MYKCAKCRKEVKLEKNDPVRCPYCGYKIFFKIREKVLKKVKAV